MPERLVIIPTYNEKENIQDIVSHVLRLSPVFDVLVVDDNSPDGTAGVVKDLQAQWPTRVHLLERAGKQGLGTAYIAGFKWAIAKRYDFVFEMDADFSHDPRYLPALVAMLERGEAELVVGSRFIPGGQDADRPFVRRMISEIARRYTRTLLSLPVEDVTSGYRGFSRRLLEAVDFDTFSSTGPSIVQELMFRAHVKGFKMKELPIVFVDRTRGQSTLTFKILVQSLLFVPRLRLRGW